MLFFALMLVAEALAQQPSATQRGDAGSTSPPGTAVSAQTANPQTGSIGGTVIDQAGAVAVGAQVQLTRAGQSQAQQATSGDNGQFLFSDLPPGPFQLTVTAPGFQARVISGVLNPAQAYLVPEIVLTIAPTTTNVSVGLSVPEVAQIEIKQQEKQRVLGIAPNFFVSYIPNAAPLNAKQKFELSWKSVIDPMTFVGVGILAGFEQAADDFSGYGQGAQGYAKRFGAGYADTFIGTFVDSAILPALFKQDPRYFYQGTGSTRSRLGHALSNAIIRKGDNGRWQPDYSGMIGSFATAGISFLYYPASDRGGSLLVQNALIGIAGGAVAGVFQEFVLHRFTSHSKDHPAYPPTNQP
jgi:hypothetical protein